MCGATVLPGVGVDSLVLGMLVFLVFFCNVFIRRSKMMDGLFPEPATHRMKDALRGSLLAEPAEHDDHQERRDERSQAHGRRHGVEEKLLGVGELPCHAACSGERHHVEGEHLLQRSAFRVWALGLRVLGLGFGVQNLGVT